MDQTAQGLKPGTTIGQYTIEAPLGVGGFGAVYRARHAQLGHGVALKLLHPEHATSEDLLERFFREARATAAVGSRHIARVHDCGYVDGWHFIAMELLVGESLEHALGPAYPRTPLAPGRSIAIGLQILESLAAAHAAGIVHRDLKPGNIYLCRDADTGEELVKLLDFGVSKILSEETHKKLTQTGVMLGTPLYMAPEQFHNARGVDHRCDLYSAAAVVYEMLTGHVPFEATGYAELVVKLVSEHPRPVSKLAPSVSPELGSVVMRGLAVAPEDRWPDAKSFGVAICANAAVARPPSLFAAECGDMTLQPSDQSTRPGVALAAGRVPSPREADAIPTMAAMPGPAHFPDVPLPPSHPPSGTFEPSDSATQAPPAAAPDAASAATIQFVPEAPTPAPAPAPPPRRRRWWLVAAVVVGLVVVGGGVGAAVAIVPRLISREPAVVRAPLPVPPAPAPAPLPQPQPQPAQNPLGLPVPLPQVGDAGAQTSPIGQVFNTVLGTVGEGLASQQAAVPMDGDATTGVQLYHPQLVGQLEVGPIEAALRAAQPGMASCRQPGQAVRVRLEGQVNFNQLGSVGPSATNQGALPAAQCVADQFRRAVPQGWAPGNAGVFFFDVALAAR
jgi:serine/threonine-protein kinase